MMMKYMSRRVWALDIRWDVGWVGKRWAKRFYVHSPTYSRVTKGYANNDYTKRKAKALHVLLRPYTINDYYTF